MIVSPHTVSTLQLQTFIQAIRVILQPSPVRPSKPLDVLQMLLTDFVQFVLSPLMIEVNQLVRRHYSSASAGAPLHFIISPVPP
ncbi:MAG: hypothetical protein AABZ58_12380, partial [Chloroflexota bacterium]